MTILLAPRKIKLELMSDEIEVIRDELERTEHNIYVFLDYKKIVEKLNKALEKK